MAIAQHCSRRGRGTKAATLLRVRRLAPASWLKAKVTRESTVHPKSVDKVNAPSLPNRNAKAVSVVEVGGAIDLGVASNNSYRHLLCHMDRSIISECVNVHSGLTKNNATCIAIPRLIAITMGGELTFQYLIKGSKLNQHKKYHNIP